MLLIADSGSTQTTWVLVDDAQHQLMFYSDGYNPCYNQHEEITESLKNSLPQGYDWNMVTTVAFYGAGCYETNSHLIEQALRPLFTKAKIHVSMDLMAAAHALLGNTAGFAAILGTGTNSCLYDGKRITHYIDSLGFMLGDEGSGGYLGKRLIGDYIRGYMPTDLSEQFRETYRLSEEELIDQIYSDPMPNRYCARYTYFFTGQYGSHPYLEKLKKESFRAFFKNIVVHYPHYRDYPFNCVGSVGWIFQETLEEVIKEYGMKKGAIIQHPIDGLIRYYLGAMSQE